MSNTELHSQHNFQYILSKEFINQISKINIKYSELSNHTYEKILNNLEIYFLDVYVIFIITQDDFNILSQKIEEWIHIPKMCIVLITANKKISDFKESNLNTYLQLVLPKFPDIETLLSLINLMERCFQTQFDLEYSIKEQKYKMYELLQVGELLSQEKDFDKLMTSILYQMRILVHAISGSIYIIERKKDGTPPTHIRFKTSSLALSNNNEFLLPINSTSIAGYVALTGEALIIDDVYHLPKDVPYQFNYEYDKKFTHRTKSIMTIPLKNISNKTIGVIQLINRTTKNQFLEDSDNTTTKNNLDNIISFSKDDFELASSMASSAAIAIENNLLFQDIESLFQGFVTASVMAIEQRDITTSGHSFRVASLTNNLAIAVNNVHTTTYANLTFSKNQLQELKYASLLHDFGKVGVREEVLKKSKKIYKQDMDNIFLRYHLLKKQIEEDFLKKQIYLYKNNLVNTQKLDQLQQWKKKEIKKLEALYENILQANEPTILKEEILYSLNKATDYTVYLDENLSIPFLKENEILDLSIQKGTLNINERKEIESHVVHTYNFLKQIPWTTDLKLVPKIAQDHHEKLNGSGYPSGLQAKDICVQTRMMTIADIFDALTAKDRPYKQELPVDKALDILQYEVNDGNIDSVLFNIFVESKAYEISSL